MDQNELWIHVIIVVLGTITAAVAIRSAIKDRLARRAYVFLAVVMLIGVLFSALYLLHIL